MKEEYSLRIAIVVSIMMHSFLFVRVPNFKPVKIPHRNQELEVVYFEIKEKTQKRLKSAVQPSQKNNSLPKKLDVTSNLNVQTEKSIGQSLRQKDADARVIKIEREPSPRTILDPGNKLVPDIALRNEKETAAYLNYFQALREKVRQAIGHPGQNETGEVHLTFTVFSSGELKVDSLKVLEESSSRSVYLRTLARKGVEDASPFPPFPKSLPRSSVTFNLIVSFEVKG